MSQNQEKITQIIGPVDFNNVVHYQKLEMQLKFN